MTALTSLDDVLILFDWNGTIVADAERARHAINGVLDSRSLPPVSVERFPDVFRLPLSALFGSLGVAEAELPTAEREWNTAMVATTAPARAGAVAALDALRARGARIGVVTAAASEAVWVDLKELQIDDLLDSVDAAVADKQLTLEARRGERERAVYVGDTEYDIRCALQAGFVAIGVSGGYCPPERLRAAGAHAIVDHLGELVDLLAEFALPAG